MRSLFLRSLILAAITLFVTGPAMAQTPRATIRGVILDQTDARLPNVAVVVTREETTEARHSTTDSQGRFTFAELPAGRYSIEAKLAGFSTYRNRAQLAVGQELWVEAQLAVTATATVTAAGEARPPLLEQNSPALSTVILQDQVANLPLDGRNFLELALLAPGTAPAPQGSASSVRGDFAFSVNGAPRGLQRLPARRRLQRRPEARAPRRAAAGGRHPRVRGR